MRKFTSWLKLREMGFGPYIGNCVDTDSYQVYGACSDQNTEAKNKKIRQGDVAHKKVHKLSGKIK